MKILVVVAVKCRKCAVTIADNCLNLTLHVCCCIARIVHVNFSRSCVGRVTGKCTFLVKIITVNADAALNERKNEKIFVDLITATIFTFFCSFPHKNPIYCHVNWSSGQVLFHNNYVSFVERENLIVLRKSNVMQYYFICRNLQL